MKITPFLIEQYFNGELSQDVRDEIEMRLTNDQIKELSVILYEINDAISRKEELEIRRHLSKYKDNNLSRRISSRYLVINLIKREYLIAAVVLLILFSVILSVLFYTYNQSSEKIFLANYEVYKDRLTSRSDYSSSEDGLLDSGFAYYDNQQYSLAIMFFDSTLKITPNNNLCKIYKGVSFIEMNLYTDAIQCFKQIINSEDILYKEIALWYLSMVYLKTDQIKLAVYYLEQIQSYQYKKVRKILRTIR
jgi:tetratricopeptide (TPR) repeat protein